MNFALLSFVYYLNVLLRMLFPMLAPQFASLYLLSDTGIGNLFFMHALGFGASLFCSQFISAKIGYQNTVCLSALSSGLLYCFLPHPQLSLLFPYFFILIGAAGGLFLPSAIAYLTTLSHPDKIGRAISSFSSVQTLALISAPLIAAAIGNFLEMFTLLGIGLMIFGVSLWMFGKEAPYQERPFSLEYIKGIFRSKTFWLIFLMNSLAMGLNIGIYTIGPLYFIKQEGLSPALFYPALSFSRVLGILASLSFGYLADTAGLRSAILGAVGLTGISTLFLGILDPSSALILFCLQGPLAVALTTIMYIAISKVSPDARKASLVSLFSSSSFLLGAGVIPQMMGILGDLNLFGFGFIALGTVGLTAALLLYRSNVAFAKMEEVQ